MEKISDVEAWFLLSPEKQVQGIPPAVKLSSVTAALLGWTSLAAGLASLPAFSISSSMVIPDAPHTGNCFLMEGKPQVKVVAKKTIKGTIYTLNATIKVVHPSENIEKELYNLPEMSDFDHVVRLADGTYLLFRSLPGTSFLHLEDDCQTVRTLTMKVSSQSVTSWVNLKD